jgi:hypothetical protein
VTNAFITDWIWILAFFPLWLISSGTMFALAYAPKKAMGAQAQKFTNALALVLSLWAATGTLMWLECTSLIHLPFARQGCNMLPAAILHPAWL